MNYKTFVIEPEPTNQCVAQMEEYLIRIQEVVGSIPITLTKLYSGLEQWTARLAHNQEVTGSNPVSATTNFIG